MTIELTLLTWTLVLALVQILLASVVRTRETGMHYNATPRDVPALKPPGLLSGRLMRAQHNLFETLPLFIAAILIADAAHLDNNLTYWGAMLYFWARVVYVPLYALGIQYVRSLAWMVSVVGLVLVLSAIL